VVVGEIPKVVHVPNHYVNYQIKATGYQEDLAHLDGFVQPAGECIDRIATMLQEFNLDQGLHPDTQLPKIDQCVGSFEQACLLHLF
jgi:hypothetical protein